MALPSEPGWYEDPQGDLWLLGDDGLWEHGARRLGNGELTPVMGRFTGRMTATAFEHLATGPQVTVLPLRRVEVPDIG
ncbi:hypothetical protein [Nocardia puris]|uniref:Uncharacterized protein n=1 Tax=Nocardia puris TaxID=208602 RepID=A0A366DAB6_9NOCA|nr:hypothetical protein [Nocardia puris]RBO87001.1 hypothetical protein DFR74_112178 [Nocardia puris]